MEGTVQKPLIQIPTHVQRRLMAVLSEEAARMQYGKLVVEFTVHGGKVTNMQAETKRSVNINEPQK